MVGGYLESWGINKITKLAQKFFDLFQGLDRSHGHYSLVGVEANDKGKMEAESGKGRYTANGPPTVELWDQHLGDGPGLGIVPIRADNTCLWGANDIDVYQGLDLRKLDKECRRLGLPLVVCRTKSGGAHTYLFLKEPAPAELVRDRLDEWATALGHAGCEVFPKQTRLAGEKDFGSWINMPYAGNIKTTRYAIGTDGTALLAEEFLMLAAERAITLEQLQNLRLPDDELLDDFFLHAPPCLQTLARTGFGDWQNNSMFNIAVYLKKRHGDGWKEKIDTYNQKYMQPPLGHADLNAITKSVDKKKYVYMCKQDPIKAVCNKRLCLTREFGIGGLPDDPGVVFGPLIKLETQPATWIWDVNGARIELQTADLMDQRKFQTRVIEELNTWPQMIKPNTWGDIVREKLAACEVIKVPEDATREGQLWVQLHKFCTSRLVGKSLDELLLSKPYTDEKEQITYFCATDFLAYLTQHRITGVNERDLYKWLRKRGVKHHFNVIKGKGLNYWSVQAFTAQTEEFQIPQVNQEFTQ